MLNINPTKTNSWKKLLNHFNDIKNKNIIDFFKEDINRFNKFSFLLNKNILIDFSKNILNNKTINLFIELLNEINFNNYLSLMLNGEILNITENKFVLNFLLRDINNYFIKNKNIKSHLLKEKKIIDNNLNKVELFTNNILKGKWLGFNKKKIINIVNIGIGGSDLGPRMIIKALNLYKNSNINMFFVSNIDIDDIYNVLINISPENTIFIVCSKSFSTQETILNFNIAKKWVLDYFDNNIFALNNHFIIITSNYIKAKEFILNHNNIFVVSDWVGGRFSFCSAFGLSISLYIGFKNFKKLLLGAHFIDKHFFFSKLNMNIPILLAIINIWYNNFFQFKNELVLVYNEKLSFLPLYLQQLFMESNGKNIDRNGNIIKDYNTSSIIWGGLGTCCQHSFFQLLHQGTNIIPCDFIIECCFKNNIYNSYYKLVSNLISQSQCLAFGDNILLNVNSSKDKNLNYKFNKFFGNRPNNVFLIKKINPYNLGTLIALYEYKMFVQGIIWNICSFDQLGVELGKRVSNLIYPLIKKNNLNFNKEIKKNKIFLDSSTLNLIKVFKKFNDKR